MSASISLIANMNVKADSVEIDACWSRIGVRGDRSCPELERHIHCRNCPKYGAAARAILDTRSPDSSNASWNEPIPDFRNLGERAHSATVFSLGAERFGLPTHRCVEVVESRTIHSLPHRRNGVVLGVANVRGRLLTCVSLAAILRSAPGADSNESRERGRLPRLLVIGSEQGPVAAPVDAIHGVASYRARDLKPVPATLAQSQTRHTQGVLELDGHAVGVLDADLLSDRIARSLA